MRSSFVADDPRENEEIVAMRRDTHSFMTSVSMRRLLGELY